MFLLAKNIVIGSKYPPQRKNILKNTSLLSTNLGPVVEVSSECFNGFGKAMATYTYWSVPRLVLLKIRCMYVHLKPDQSWAHFSRTKSIDTCAPATFFFQNQIICFPDTLSHKYHLVLKTNNCRGKLTDVSAKTKSLTSTQSTFHSSAEANDTSELCGGIEISFLF